MNEDLKLRAFMDLTDVKYKMSKYLDESCYLLIALAFFTTYACSIQSARAAGLFIAKELQRICDMRKDVPKLDGSREHHYKGVTEDRENLAFKELEDSRKCMRKYLTPLQCSSMGLSFFLVLLVRLGVNIENVKETFKKALNELPLD